MSPPRLLAAIAILSLTAGLAVPTEAAPDRGRARFEAVAGESLLVHGEYPPVQSTCVASVQPVLHARYRGALEVGRAGDGSLFVIGELPFEDYLKGIAEVPRSWHIEALKAQVVAARSYATVQRERTTSDERALGYDLCATTACQVYLGMGVEAGAWGDRWVRAVEETAGEVLMHEGAPAETFYFSTSNGRTYSNQQVWGSAALAYLPGVPELDDGDSPLSRWDARIPLRDLAQFLSAAGRWAGGRIERVRDKGDHIVVRGNGRARLHRDDLRDALNRTAWCLSPSRYPSTEPDGYRLPQTVPSIWYRARQEGRALVLEGRGWGHGVGMVQWGAKGKADRGLTYDDILAAYYGGLRPQPHRPPETVRVLIARGLRSVVIAPSGEAAARPPGRAAAPRAPWRVTGAAGRLRVRHTEPPPPTLVIDDLKVRSRDGSLRAAFTAPKSVRARLEVIADGEVVAAGAWRDVSEGRARIRGLRLDDPGSGEVRLRATDGVDVVVVRAGGADVEDDEAADVPGAEAAPEAGDGPEATETPTPAPTARAAPEDGDGPGLVAILALAALGGVLLLTALLRRRLHRT